MKVEKRQKISLPDIDWKSSTCIVCGKKFDYLTKRKPPTCNQGECRYRFHYSIKKEDWAGFQYHLFDKR